MIVKGLVASNHSCQPLMMMPSRPSRTPGYPVSENLIANLYGFGDKMDKYMSFLWEIPYKDISNPSQIPSGELT